MSLAPDRNELLLQIFFGRHAGPGALRGHLDRHRQRLEEALATYRTIEESLAAEDSPDRTYWLLTVRHGLALVEAGLAWNADAAALLDQENAP